KDKKNLLNLFFGIAPIEEIIDEHRKGIEKDLEKATVNYNDYCETFNEDNIPEEPELPDLPILNVDPEVNPETTIPLPDCSDLIEESIPDIENVSPRIIIPQPDLAETEKIKDT